MRIIVADAHPVVRAGLFSFFQETDIQILSEAVSGEQLLQKVESLQPVLIMMDSHFPDETGFQTVEKLRRAEYPGKTVFFADTDRISNYARALALGVDGWFLKKTNRLELIRSLHLVMEGEPNQRHGELLRVTRSMAYTPQRDFLDILTPREKQVLQQIVHGLSNKEIAAFLGLSRDTVKEYVRNILRKLEVKDRTAAAVWAIQNNAVHDNRG